MLIFEHLYPGMDSEKEFVFKSYDLIANWYADNRNQDLMERSYLDKLIGITGPNATILDLGCGTGLPIMSYLISRGMKVTGVDASKNMLDLARQNLPDADFLKLDMRGLKLTRQFDAIIAWNSFFHLPPEDQPDMFRIFQSHLKPGGVLLFTSGTTHGEAWGINGGINLYHGSLNTRAYEQLLENHHFSIIEYNENDPQCGHFNIWLTQKK